MRDREGEKAVDAQRRSECENTACRFSDRGDVDRDGHADHGSDFRDVPFGFISQYARFAARTDCVMSDPSPRRTRPPSTPPPGGIPLIPILIAVVVLGFVIGAGLSLVGKRGPTQTVVVHAAATATATVTESPTTPAPTEPPASPAPAAPRSPEPTDAPTDVPSVTPSPPKASHVPTADASPRATARATARARVASVAPSPDSPATAVPATAAPARVPSTVVAVTAPPQLEAPASSDDTDSEFAKLATAVVRQYIAAVARGDDATARAAFGSDAPASLAEVGIVNASTRIQHIEARSAGDNVTVNVDLRTATGLYFGQYTVHRASSGAALIANHAINKL